jgi:hypothetical protein
MEQAFGAELSPPEPLTVGAYLAAPPAEVAVRSAHAATRNPRTISARNRTLIFGTVKRGAADLTDQTPYHPVL